MALNLPENDSYFAYPFPTDNSAQSSRAATLHRALYVYGISSVGADISIDGASTKTIQKSVNSFSDSTHSVSQDICNAFTYSINGK